MTGFWGTSAGCETLYSLLFCHDRLLRYFSWLWDTLKCVILSWQVYEVLQLVFGHFIVCYSFMTAYVVLQLVVGHFIVCYSFMTAYVVLLLIVGHFIVCYSFMTGLWGTSAGCDALYNVLFCHARLMKYFKWLWGTLQCVILSWQAYEVL